MLLEVVERQGDAEAQQIRDAGAADAAHIRAAADVEAQSAISAHVEAKKHELRAANGRRLAAARWAARRSVFDARERLLARVIQATVAQLPRALIGEATDSRVATLLDEAWEYLPPGPVTIRCQPTLVESVQRLVAARGTVNVVSDPTIVAGVRMESPTGRLTIDNTLDARLDRMWRAIAAELVRGLAGELTQ